MKTITISLLILAVLIAPFPSSVWAHTLPEEEVESCGFFCEMWHDVKDFFLTVKVKAAGLFSKEKAGVYPEVERILATNNTDERSKIYRELIERVGVEEAQDALYYSGLPFTGETHLVQHVAGGYIFENYGLEGITKCRLHFLAACYHEFIITLLSREGADVLPEVMEECWKHGPAVATQCAHGIGHGFVTYYDYKNLPEAAAACDTLAKDTSNFPRLNCLDGVFMENLWALHPGEEAPERWIKPEDPLYPCNDPRIKEEWQEGCWMNQASVMYQHFNHDLKKVSNACASVQNSLYRETCFDNLARQIHPLTEGNFEKTVSMCGEIDPRWQDFCRLKIAVSDFSVGGRTLPYQICAAEEGAQKEDCYQQLIGIITVYATTPAELRSFCGSIEESSYRSQCLNAEQF